MRILSWNIHHGTDEKNQPCLEGLAAAIRAEHPDVVLLQEVDRNCTRTNQIDQAAKLGELTNLQAHFGSAFDLQGGHYGQAILSRYPVSDLQIHRLPSSEDDEQRVLVRAKVETPHGPWIIATAHLDATNAPRRHVQAQMVADILLKSPLPVVLAGDFNAPPSEATMKVFAQAPWLLGTKAGKSPFTSPAVQPTAEIDHFVLRGLRFNEKLAILEKPGLSDHRPVLATVTSPN